MGQESKPVCTSLYRDRTVREMFVLLHLILLFCNVEAQSNSIVGTTYSDTYYTSSRYNEGNCGYITCWGTTTQGDPFTRTTDPIELRVRSQGFTGNLIEGRTINSNFSQPVTLSYTWNGNTREWRYTVNIRNLTKDLEGDYQCFLGFASPTHTINKLVEERNITQLPSLSMATAFESVTLGFSGFGQPNTTGLVIRNSNNAVIHRSTYYGAHTFAGSQLQAGVYYIDYDLNAGSSVYPCGYVYGFHNFTIPQITLIPPTISTSCNGAKLVLTFDKTQNVDKIVVRYRGEENHINLNVTTDLSIEITTKDEVYIDFGHSGNHTYPYGYQLSASTLTPYNNKVLVTGLVTLFLALAIIACCVVFLIKTKETIGDITMLKIVLAVVFGLAAGCCLLASIIVPASADSCSYIKEELAAAILSVLCNCGSTGIFIYTVVAVVRAHHNSNSRVGARGRESETLEGNVSNPRQRNGQLPPIRGGNREINYR